MSLLWKTIKGIIPKYDNDKPSPADTGRNGGFARDLLLSKRIPRQRDSIKGISLFTLFNYSKTVPASMTVEAAAILPLLLFFFLNLTSAIEMIRLHGNLELAVWETGRRMAVYGYAYDQMITPPEKEEESDSVSWLDGLSGLVLNNIYARNEVINYTGIEYLDHSPLTYGADGLNFLESRFMENDCIDIRVTYQVSPWFTVPGFPSFRMANRFYGRSWTGYDVNLNEGNGTEDFVWVTETGKVYHESPECSYLKRNIRTVSLTQIPLLRNEAGELYTRCWLCGEGPGTTEVYITQDGNRYHSRFDCSSLKRTVYTILRIEAVKKYRPCSRCG